MYEHLAVYPRVEQGVLPGLEAHQPLTDRALMAELMRVAALAHEVERNYHNRNGATSGTRLDILPTLAHASNRADGLFAEATNRGIIKVEN